MLKDMTGDFDISFYVMGAIMTFSGLMCLPLPRMAASEDKKVIFYHFNQSF